MLELHDVTASYGVKQILFGVNLTVGAGEVVTLMGRNGMGKTTTINSILGFTRANGGGIRFENTDIRGWPSYRIARSGIGLVPEGRQIFSNLTVRENLIATAAKAKSKKASWSLSDVYRLFPRLEERQSYWGWQLSGGEQQMLAIGRALLTNPQLLILDEATEGDLLPNLPSFIRRVCSGYAPLWGVLRTRLV
jgi:branched-chain amino acid transport system ATP-binding protein